MHRGRPQEWAAAQFAQELARVEPGPEPSLGPARVAGAAPRPRDRGARGELAQARRSLRARCMPRARTSWRRRPRREPLRPRLRSLGPPRREARCPPGPPVLGA